MCARYTLTLEQARLVIAGLVHIFAFAPRYNIGPAQRVPVILDTAEGVKAVEMRWGIPSAWSKTLHINAQAENIHQTTTFKPLPGQRCLAPMDGFYEWKPDKSPVRFVRRRRELFCVAGLWADDPYRWGEAPDEPPKDGGRKERLAGISLRQAAARQALAPPKRMERHVPLCCLPPPPISSFGGKRTWRTSDHILLVETCAIKR